jgi:hypothetical protein
MERKTHRFESAALAVGEGQCRRWGQACAVELEVRTAGKDYQPEPGGRGAFLDGRIRAEGRLCEECRPGASLLAPGRQAVLKLSVQGRWSLASVLILELGRIHSPTPARRLYEWTFLVVDKPCDQLQLFGAEAAGDELALDDLLALLGAAPEEVGRAEQGQEVTYTAEGGFRLHAAD